MVTWREPILVSVVACTCLFVTFCVSRRRRKIYCGHARLCVCVCVFVCLSVYLSVCLSAAVRPTQLQEPGCNLGAW